MTPAPAKPKRAPAKRATSRTPKVTAKRAAPAAVVVPTSIARKSAPVRRTYLFAVGRRKSAVARVRYTAGNQESLLVNNQPMESYFATQILQDIVRHPLEVTAHQHTGTFSAHVAGGGTHGQAEAVRLGIARVLTLAEAELRPTLKHAGLLTRDPRVKERKKYGLKRARRAPQWQKR